MNVPVTEQTERREAGPGISERILVRAPSGDDAALIAEVLGREGCEVVRLDDHSALAREWDRGAGALALATEALNDPDCCLTLRELLDAQEPWSEIPVVLLGGGAEDEEPRVAGLLGNRAQLLILERVMMGSHLRPSAKSEALTPRMRSGSDLLFANLRRRGLRKSFRVCSPFAYVSTIRRPAFTLRFHSEEIGA